MNFGTIFDNMEFSSQNESITREATHVSLDLFNDHTQWPMISLSSANKFHLES